MPTIYQRLLGDRWEILAEPVRQVHVAREEIRGRFRITHGKSCLVKHLIRWSRLPQSATGTDTQLRIFDEGHGERWERRFDGHPFTTKQWAGRRGYLVERFEHWELDFELQVNGGNLSYVQRRARLCFGKIKLPFPSALSPLVSATESPEGQNQLRVKVTVELPIVGLIIAYNCSLEIKESVR